MPVAQHLKAFLESSSQLLGQHIALARLELREDAKVMAGQFARIAVFALLLIVGYGFLCAAVAMYLSRFMGADVATALVGGVNILAGVAGVNAASRTLKEKAPLAESLEQAELTARVLQRDGVQGDARGR
ncbi:MAG: phage holin family protein [Myxococcaceae bacterium]|nr:phage holin family protein [Myxococcaceae bacterium]